MTKKIFTDDSTGEKYELDDNDYWKDKELLVIKPLEAEKKRPFRLDFVHTDGLANFEPWTFTNSLELSEPTAQAIAEAIKATLELITTPYDSDKTKIEAGTLFVLNEARNAFMKDRG
jgi:hypothetical protein